MKAERHKQPDCCQLARFVSGNVLMFKKNVEVDLQQLKFTNVKSK